METLDINRIRAVTERMADYILATANLERDDRLWPAHYQLFGTNPMGLSYGASGTALYLHNVLGEVPADITQWLIRQPLSLNRYPPGLFMGLAGIAYSFFELGLAEEAEEVLHLAYESPLLYEGGDLFSGAAGWGFASLYFYLKTGQSVYLDKAVQAGEYLITAAEADGATRCWRNPMDGKVHFGYGYGASGIGLFLLYLHKITGREAFLTLARQGVEYDLSHALKKEGTLWWGKYKEDPFTLPYWLHGSAGVGSVLLRFHRLLGEERYKVLAEKVARSTFVKFTILPNLFTGLSGVGAFMLDLYTATGDVAYLNRAHDMAETVLWFKVERPEGIAYPGRWLIRLSNDYGTGSAGIGLFLRSLLNPGQARAFLDLPLAEHTKTAAETLSVVTG